MSFLNQLLASFFEKFKTQSPTAYFVISLIITGAFVLSQSDVFTALFPNAPWLNKSVEVIAFAYALISGTHTSKYTQTK